jgi:hypothetical protein
MGEQMISLGVSVVLGAILMVPLFGLVRRLGKNWWVWGGTLTIAFAAFVSLIAPVYIASAACTTRSGPTYENPWW